MTQLACLVGKDWDVISSYCGRSDAWNWFNRSQTKSQSRGTNENIEKEPMRVIHGQSNNTLQACPSMPIITPFSCSAGPETQAMTHTDGGLKCGVQVSLVKEVISTKHQNVRLAKQEKVISTWHQNVWLAKVRWEPAEGSQLEPSFQVTITRFVHLTTGHLTCGDLKIWKLRWW